MNDGVLNPLRMRLTGWLALRILLVLFGILGSAALAAMLFDAALDLPEVVRVAAPWILAVCAVAVIGVGVWHWRGLNERRVAKLFERLEPALGNRLTNAVQLASKTGASSVEEFLRREAIELGRRTAAGLKAWPVVRRGMKFTFAAAGATLLAWVGFIWLAGDLKEAVFPRFLDPRGDHPPYSRLKIDVQPRGTEALFGGQVEIRATANGRPVDKLWLVAKATTNSSRTIMFLSPDKAFFQTLANLREPTEYFVTDGSARSRRFLIGIRYTPQITLVEVTTEFPSYTGKPAKTARLAEEPQALPEETRVSFRVASNRPLKSGRLALTPVLGGKPIEVPLKPESSGDDAAAGVGIVLGDGRLVPPLPLGEGETPPTARQNRSIGSANTRPTILPLPREEGRSEGKVTSQTSTSSHIVTGSFTLTNPVAFTLSVRDVSGLDCAEPRHGRFNLSPDERPRLIVLEPGRNAVATPSIRIPVRVQAQDDYGVTRVAWLRGHNRSIERPLNLKLALKDDARSVESVGALELDKLGVRPGDVIDYYFEAADNYPKGPNVALSRMYRLEIISDEQYQEVLRQATARKALFESYFKMGAWLRRMAEHSRGVQGKAEKSDPAAREEAKALAEQLDKYDRELSKLLQNPTMFDIEESFRATLGAQQARIAEAKKKLKNALGSEQLDPKQFKELAEELSRLSETEQEQITQPAQQIASVVQVMSRADAFVRLAQQQATLAEMLRRFADNTNALSRIEQREVQELAHQQERIQNALHTLLTQLPELLSKVPTAVEFDPLRRDVNAFVKAVTNAKIESDLAGAAKELSDLETVTGHAFAQLAAQKMDQLIGKCQGMGSQGKQCLTARFQPKLKKPGMGNSLQQIMAALGSGAGQGGRDGYALFNDDVSLYGPNAELAGEQAGGRRENESGSGRGRQVTGLTGDVRDPAVAPPEGPGRVRLQPDAKFPLRYREVVGEYFRAIAETGAEEAEREKVGK